MSLPFRRPGTKRSLRTTRGRSRNDECNCEKISGPKKRWRLYSKKNWLTSRRCSRKKNMWAKSGLLRVQCTKPADTTGLKSTASCFREPITSARCAAEQLNKLSRCTRNDAEHEQSV